MVFFRYNSTHVHVLIFDMVIRVVYPRERGVHNAWLDWIHTSTFSLTSFHFSSFICFKYDKFGKSSFQLSLLKNWHFIFRITGKFSKEKIIVSAGQTLLHTKQLLLVFTNNKFFLTIFISRLACRYDTVCKFIPVFEQGFSNPHPGLVDEFRNRSNKTRVENHNYNAMCFNKFQLTCVKYLHIHQLGIFTFNA